VHRVDLERLSRRLGPRLSAGRFGARELGVLDDHVGEE